MADALLKVILADTGILSIDYVGTGLPTDFIAGLVVQGALAEADILKSAKALTSIAGKTEGIVRQAILIRFWVQVKDYLKTLEPHEFARPDLSNLLFTHVELHYEAFGFPSSLQDDLIFQVNSTIDFACENCLFDDFIIYLGYFCSIHRAFIKAKWRLFEAPSSQLKILCSYKDPKMMHDVLRANVTLCEFAIRFQDSPRELLRIVIFNTLYRTLKYNIERHAYLRKTVRPSLEKFHALFTPKQIDRLTEFAEQLPPTPTHSTPPPRNDRVRFAISVEEIIISAYQNLLSGKGEPFEEAVTGIADDRQADTPTQVLEALKVLGRKLDFDQEEERTRFSKLMQGLNEADLLSDEDFDEFEYQFYPPEQPKQVEPKPQVTTTQTWETRAKVDSGAIRLNSEGEADDPWAQITRKSKPKVSQESTGDPWAGINDNSTAYNSDHRADTSQKPKHRESQQTQEESKQRDRSRQSRSHEEQKKKADASKPVDLYTEIDALIEKNACSEDDEVKVSELVSRYNAVLRGLPVQSKAITVGSAPLGFWVKNSPFDVVLMVDNPAKIQELANSLTEALRISTFAIDTRQLQSQFGQKVQYTDKHLNFSVSFSFNVPLQILHKKILMKYLDLDSRFTSLALVVKIWAQARGLLGEEYFSGYEWTLLVANFCQTRSPPVLPSLQARAHKPQMENGVDIWFDEGYKKDSLNKTELIDLVLELFRWYGVEIKNKGNAVIADVKTGTLRAAAIDQTSLIAIVDPFFPDPLGKSVPIRSRQASNLQNELERAFRHLEAGNSLLRLINPNP